MNFWEEEVLGKKAVLIEEIGEVEIKFVYCLFVFSI